ncbi:MAG: ferritin family protein [Desulfuromonadales bacterium]|nr:ferritin family protein [Desulfuromonadales bacterium]
MVIDVQEAVKRSIMTEKNAMYFYQLGAEMMKDQSARELFELLAREEREHAAQFHRIYKGVDIPSLEVFLDTPPDNTSSWVSSISRLIAASFSEKKAMELALEREKNLEETLMETAATIADPEVRAVFEMNARETRNHYLLIESDYARLMGMVNELDMDTYVRE